MTKIAYAGNFDAPHSTENHVAKALENLGHSVIRLPEQRMDWATLPAQVEDIDLFLWTRTAGFDPGNRSEQGRIIKSLDIPTVGFHLDRWWGLSRESKADEHGPKAPDPSPFFWLDYLFTADGGHDAEWESIGANHHWSPPGILSDEAKRVGTFRREYSADVAFVGNLRKYAHPEWGPYRLKLYNFLARTYKGRFKLWEGGIRGQDLADLYASVKVLVGDSCLAGGATRYWSDRIPETLGRGGYLVHPAVEGLGYEYPWLQVYELGNFDDLAKRIDEALDPEFRYDRDLLIGMNRQHVLENHTYEHRMERVLATVLG